MQVYIEYVLIDNLVIDYFLLKATHAITASPTSKLRLILSAIFGAVVALSYPLVYTIPFISVLIKVLSGLTMVIISVKAKTFRTYYINALVFFCLTFLTGGAIIGVFTLFNLDYSSEISIALMVLPAYLIIKGATTIIKHVYRQKDIRCYTYDVEIAVKERTVRLKGFVDTGNGLYDGDRAVVVVNKSTATKILGNFSGISLKRITVKTVAGEKQNLAFEIDGIKIYIGDKVNINNRVTVCVTSTEIGDGYDVILHPALMEIRNDRDFKETKKVC